MSTVPPEGTPDPTPDGTEPPAAYEAPAAPPLDESAPPPAAPPPPPYGQPAYGVPIAAPLSPSDERLWATLAHIGPLVIGFLAPLIIWLVFKDRSRFVDDQGKEALNFQIAVTIAAIVAAIATFWALGFGAVIVGVVALVYMILGAVAANRGEPYRYPVTWRIVK